MNWSRIAHSVYFVVLSTLAASFLITWWVRSRATAHGLMDLPNERSSHSAPTPRGGGMGIVLATLIGIASLFLTEKIDSNLMRALVFGGVPIAWIGWVDDRRSVSAKVRLTVHFAAASWAVFALGGVAPIQIGAHLVPFGVTGNIVSVVAIVWVVNLFNFMDGIDGIAGSESAFICIAGACLSAAVPIFPAALVVAAASFGLLAWNWPPAKIFMGDIGSGFLGFVIAILALGAARESPVAYFVWLVLGGVFFVDATITLGRRVLRGESASVAHRSHSYQRLSRRWGDHRRVTLSILVIGVAWLLPSAWLISRFPRLALPLALLALAPLVVLAFAIGSGKDDKTATTGASLR